MSDQKHDHVEPKSIWAKLIHFVKHDHDPNEPAGTVRDLGADGIRATKISSTLR